MGKRRFLVLLAASLLGLVLIEAAVRVRQFRRYGTTLTTYYELADDPVSGLRIPKPDSDAGPIHVNSLGFRGDELEVPKPPGRLRVAFLGGSTTFCAEASALATTWPYQVVAGLRAAFPGLDVDLVNGGAAAFSTAESLRNLEHRVGPLAPDVVVIYHATNDLVIESRRRALTLGLYRLEEHEAWWLDRYWLSGYLLRKNLRHLLRRDEDDPGRMPFTPEILAPFRARLGELVRAVRARGAVPVLVTFATRLRAGETPEEQRAAAASALGYMPFFDVPDLLAGYAEANRIVRAVAAESGTPLVEGEDSIPGDAEHFADTVHLRDPGLALQAERVLAGLLAAPEVRARLGH